jgi:hypothetical protein
MKNTTRYRYEERIRQLEAEVQRLKPYRDLAWEINQAVGDVLTEGKGLNLGWLVKAFWKVCK